MNVVNGGIEIQNQVIFDVYNVHVYLFWYFQRKERSYTRTHATSTGVVWTEILVFFKDTLFSLSTKCIGGTIQVSFRSITSIANIASHQLKFRWP